MEKREIQPYSGQMCMHRISYVAFKRTMICSLNLFFNRSGHLTWGSRLAFAEFFLDDINIMFYDSYSLDRCDAWQYTCLTSFPNYKFLLLMRALVKPLLHLFPHVTSALDCFLFRSFSLPVTITG